MKEANAGKAIGDISSIRKAIDKLIKRMWDEIEAAHSEMSNAETRRNWLREWGIIYVNRGEVVRVDGVVNPTAINEVPALEGIELTPGLKMKFKNPMPAKSGIVLTFYFAAAPGLPPDETKFIQVRPGQTKEIAIETIGYSSENEYLLVENIFDNAAMYTVSARVA